MHNFPWHSLWVSSWQTFYMVFVSSFLSILIGLFVGVFLFNSRNGQMSANKFINRVLGFVVNVTRSVPYIILMIALIPLTRLIVGTSIGTNAAIVPLTLAAIPFYARVAEAAMLKVPKGLIEAAQAMGASKTQIIFKVLIPESAAGLINGASLTIISLIGYSAMAGAVGGGGLGNLAIDYGYQRFDPAVMLVTVIFLVIFVQAVQSLFDFLAKRHNFRRWLVSSLVIFIACFVIQLWPTTSSQQTLSVGIIAGVQQKIMKVAQQVALKRYDLKLKLVTFEGYVLPNIALNNGAIDANIFQDIPFLNAQIKARGFKLTPIAKTFVYPFGFYSRKIHSIAQLPYGAVVAIPEDPSNEGRALLLLQKAGLIKLAKGVGFTPTVLNIVSNPKHLQIKTLNAAQLPRVLTDAELVGLNNNYAKIAHFTVSQALIKEGPHAPYANIVVVRTQDKNNPVFKKLVAAMHSKQVINAVLKEFPNGAAIPAFKEKVN